MQDSPKKHRFLVVVHEASRSGAPLVCLYFLRWLKRSTDCSVDILLLKGGELESAFAEVGTVQRAPWYIGKHWRMPVGIRWILPHYRQYIIHFVRMIGLRCTVARKLQPKGGYDCVLCNALASLWSIRDFVGPTTPTVLWAHELEYAIVSLFYAPSIIRDALLRVNRVVACGKAVRDNLVENHGIPEDIVEITPEFVEESSVVCHERSDLPILLPDVPSNAFIVTSVGWIQWRKGPDLFLRMARHMPATLLGRPVHFVWIGGETVPGLITEMLRRAKLAGLEHRMHFLGHRENPTEIVSVSDVFVLSSREDPYALVMIESALAHCPIVAFAGSGGAEEFLADGAGLLVPYGNTKAMAKATESLLLDSDLAKATSEKAYARALLHTSEHSARRLYEACLRSMSTSG